MNLMAALSHLLLNAVVQLACWISPRRNIRGIAVLFFDRSVDVVTSATRLENALDAASLDRRGRWIHRYAKRIIVWPEGQTSAGRRWSIMLSSNHLDWDAKTLASVLVHEATHLRIRRLHAEVEGHASRSERRCVLEQASFLDALSPDGSALADELRSLSATARLAQAAIESVNAPPPGASRMPAWGRWLLRYTSSSSRSP